MEQDKNKRLLLEYKSLSYDRKNILEAIENNKPVILSGLFQEANSLNQNDRIYPYEILKREVDKFQVLIQENRAYGSLDHPDSSVIEIGPSCCLIRELTWEGMRVMGKLEIIDTTQGKNAKAALRAGGAMGVSSRAFGSTSRNSEGHEVVNDDLQLITCDVVANPSVQNAILSESYDPSKKYFFMGNVRIDRKRVINNLLDNIIKEY